jgi:transcriptional regulator with XRE-family HTH domain
MQNEENYGQTIAAAMNRLGLSNRSAAKLCGISRRHLSTAQKGENISVDVLRKIMTALGIREVAIGPDTRIETHDVPPGALPLIAIAANQMERSVALAQNAVAILRTISPASDASSGDNGD